MPPIRSNAHMMHRTRGNLRSQQSYDSQDQRITQGFRSGRLGKNRGMTRGSQESRESPLRGQSREDGVEMSPAKKKKALGRDPSFQNEMQQCLEHMERMPGLRAKVFNQLGQMTTHWNEQKGQEGVQAGQETRYKLAMKRKEREEAQKRNLEKLIEDTAGVSALQAINLDQLLRKKWTDEKDAYVIMTNIKTDKQVRRLNDLCFNRYI